MRKLLLALVMLYTGIASAQSIDVSIGYGRGIHDRGDGTNVGYGKAYLSVGERIGGTITIGGDSQISQAGEKVGKGYVGLAGWYDLFEDDDVFNLRFSLGAEQIEDFVARENSLAEYGMYDPNTGKPEFQGGKISPTFGLTASFRFVEFNAAVNGEGTVTVGFGFKLNR